MRCVCVSKSAVSSSGQCAESVGFVSKHTLISNRRDAYPMVPTHTAYIHTHARSTHLVRVGALRGHEGLAGGGADGELAVRVLEAEARGGQRVEVGRVDR